MKRVVSGRLRAAVLVAACLLAAHEASAQTTTRTRLSVSPSPSALGQTVRLSAEVDMAGSGAITGNMEFKDGASTLGAVALSTAGASMGAIASGNFHACAITGGSGLRCWGANTDGQLGDGTLISRNTFADVFGLTRGVAAVSARYYHTCALLFDRTVRCWGANGLGQLGNGTTIGRSTPVAVPGLTDIAGIAAAVFHTCAVSMSGGVSCWGYNGNGQLGDGTTVNRLTPVAVQGLTNAVAVVGGGSHTCALTSGGEVKCWGSNQNGQLGGGAKTNRPDATTVPGLSSGVIAISAGGYSTCALLGSGGVKCWGLNDNGQIGDGTTTERNAPTDVAGLTSGVVAIAAGWTHVCALTASPAVTSSLKCWGRNQAGQLGDGTKTDRTVPVRVLGMTQQPVAAAGGYAFACTLSDDRRARCWGENLTGQLGDGTSVSRSTPSRSVLGLSTVVRARATFETNALARGFHPLEAAYAGDGANLGSSGKRGHRVQ